MNTARYVLGIFQEEQVTLEGLFPLFDPQADETDFQDKPDKKSYNKFFFRKLLKKYKIINERHYQEVFRTCDDLQQCEIYTNPS